MFNENVFKMVSMIFINQIHMSHFEFRFLYIACEFNLSDFLMIYTCFNMNWLTFLEFLYFEKISLIKINCFRVNYLLLKELRI